MVFLGLILMYVSPNFELGNFYEKYFSVVAHFEFG